MFTKTFYYPDKRIILLSDDMKYLTIKKLYVNGTITEEIVPFDNTLINKLELKLENSSIGHFLIGNCMCTYDMFNSNGIFTVHPNRNWIYYNK